MLNRRFSGFSGLAMTVAFALSSLITSSAHAGNIRCLPRAVAVAAQAFELARSGAGIIAVNPRTDRPVNLGQRVNVRGLEVVDVNKDSYQVRLDIDSVNGHGVEISLETMVSNLNGEHCTIYGDVGQQLRNPNYRILLRPRQ